MKEKLKILDKLVPCATPTTDDIQRWQALPRDEQLKRQHETLTQAINSGVSKRLMNDIKQDALKRVATNKSD